MIASKAPRRRRPRAARPVLHELESRLLLTTGDPTTMAPSLGAPPAPSSSVIWVGTEAELQTAVQNLQSGQTIVIRPGTYNLTNTLYIGKNRHVTDVTIRGSTDDFNDVVLLGKGMDNANYGNVQSGISVYNAQGVTIADLSIGRVYFHPIELKGEAGASQVHIYHDRLFDAGEQFVKGTMPASGPGVSDSTVEYTVLEYTAGPPTTDHGGGIGYTNGVDILNGQNWVIRDNLFRNFHTPDSDPYSSWWNPAILMWNHSANTVAEGNTFINCDRAIAFGLYDNSGYDHQGGVIRNNFIVVQPGLFSSARKADSDAQILVWDSPGTKVVNNTILTNGNTAKSIEVRFSSTTGIAIVNNLTDAPLGARNSASYTASGNYLGATPAMFAGPNSGDLHLLKTTATQTYVIDKVATSPDAPRDWDGASRPVGGGGDIGADEYSTTTSDTTPPTVKGETPAPNATGVSVTVAPTATFSEAVQPSTIAFTLKNPAGASVAATLTYNASTNTATLTPSAALAYSTKYTATIGGAKDLAGNALAKPFTWSFTTMASPDTTPPTVKGETPAPNATGVSVTVAPTATFSEAVQPSTIAFTLKNGAGASVSATLSYDASTNTATLTPSMALAYATKYTATIGGAKDLAGNALASPFTWSFTTAASGSSNSPLDQLPLVTQSNVQYVGAFRVPGGQYGASSFEYGGTALGYNPANNSLFLVGTPGDQAVAEISIPSTIVNSANFSDLATATVLQPFAKVLPRIPNNPSSMSAGGYEAIGDLMVVGGKLVGSAYNTYDGSGSVNLSHFVLSSTNLATAQASGLYQVGTMGGGYVGGYMSEIPTEWQGALGSSYLTGQAAINILSRTSFGPAAFGFDPTALHSGVNAAVPYVYYDQAHQTLGAYDSDPPTLFNATAGGGGDNTGFGVVFVPSTRSVLFFGAIGTGDYYYGEASDAHDPNRIYKGVHSYGGGYTFQVWAYDALDFLAVKNGQENPWDLKPYSTWQFQFPQADGAKFMGGVAFDPSTGRIYFSELGVDRVDPFSSRPLIQVFQLQMGGSNSALRTSSVSGPPVASPASMGVAGPAASVVAPPAVSAADLGSGAGSFRPLATPKGPAALVSGRAGFVGMVSGTNRLAVRSPETPPNVLAVGGLLTLDES
jgi:hypothetical protein